MSPFARLVRLARANVHRLLARLRPEARPAPAPPPAPAPAPAPDDPAAALERAIFALNARLVEGKKQVAVAVADEKHVAKLVAQATAEAAEWERRAVLAIEQGDEALANQCLVRKREHAARAAGHEAEWRAYKAAADRLKASLRALSDEVEAHKREQVRLRARARAAALRAASPLEAYFSLAGRRHRAAGEGAFVLEPRAPGGRPVEVRLAADGAVSFSAALGLLPEGEAAAKLALRLLETNATALVHCAYGVRDGVVVVAATRALVDLGPNEVEAILSDFDLAIARHVRDMPPAHNARSN
ncbi:MAG TPA: PspA/IM30 family protein [Polyangiaceae bacterium]|nr:PspA/IM30 family protein [Polyangiaceae bacterium]